MENLNLNGIYELNEKYIDLTIYWTRPACYLSLESSQIWSESYIDSPKYFVKNK